MTYKEYYMQLATMEDIMEAANADMALAAVLNSDRIKVIKEAAEEVINIKFGDD